MKFIGQVSDFDSSNHSYSINFKISSDKLNISDGLAHVTLKTGETKVRISNHETYSLDDETSKFLKNKFLETIYNFNKVRISALSKMP